MTLFKNRMMVKIFYVVIFVAILATAMFVFVNPSQRIKDSRDAKRIEDVDTILSSVRAYIVDNKGALPTGLTTNMPTQLQLGTTGGAALTGNCKVAANAKVDLANPLIKYLKTIPTDPKGGTISATGYAIQVDANNLVTVIACNTEGKKVISASR
jgi:hypothetical protein